MHDSTGPVADPRTGIRPEAHGLRVRGDAIQDGGADAAKEEIPVNEEAIRDDDPCYVISIAARMVGMHQQTLRYYERVGLIEPSRSRGNIRLYSPADIGRLRQIQRLISDLGVNLAGVEVIMRMNQHLLEAEKEITQLRAEVEQCRANHWQAQLPAGHRV